MLLLQEDKSQEPLHPHLQGGERSPASISLSPLLADENEAAGVGIGGNSCGGRGGGHGATLADSEWLSVVLWMSDHGSAIILMLCLTFRLLTREQFLPQDHSAPRRLTTSRVISEA